VLLREETGLPVTVAEEPLLSVVHGVSHVLDDIELLEKISV
jgi:actin-like ATPase involved in cell morphogenesis